jgi:hypothetical protein
LDFCWRNRLGKGPDFLFAPYFNYSWMDGVIRQILSPFDSGRWEIFELDKGNLPGFLHDSVLREFRIAEHSGVAPVNQHKSVFL